MRARILFLPVATGLLLSAHLTGEAMADAISPHINDHEKVYSNEKPNAAYFGNGVAGRLSEASRLRFEGEHYTIDGQNLDLAVGKLKKAVQLDPGDPHGHVLLARAMTKKLKGTNPIDTDLMRECYEEWNLIDKHDADHTHQFEARRNLHFLKSLSKSLNEEKYPEKKLKQNKKRMFSTRWIKIFKKKELDDGMDFTL